MLESVVAMLTRCPVCGAIEHKLLATFDEPCPGESRYGLGSAFLRDLMICMSCRTVYNRHSHDLAPFYADEYRRKSYIDSATGKSLFEKIVSLPPEQSDNTGRLNFILDYVHFKAGIDISTLGVLDVGSGMGIFPYSIKKYVNSITVIDPGNDNCEDMRQKSVADVVINDYFPSCYLVNKKFDLICFNKVLEHVLNWEELLISCKPLLSNNGLIYLEVPDGTAALKAGVCRQEFFLEHYFAPSMQGVRLMAKKADYEVLELQTLKEPSGKYSIRAFLGLGY